MWEIIIGLPYLAVSGFLQVSLISKVHLLQGSPDLLLLGMLAWSINAKTRYAWIITVFAGLIMSYLSAMPMNGYVWMYLFLWLVIHFLKMKVWQMPMILMLFMTIIGTIFISAGTLGLLFLQNASVVFMDAVRQILVPSLVLNIIFSIPIYAFLNDVINSIYINEVSE